jgi:hypothetical protein
MLRHYVPSDQSSCIKESQDSHSGDEQPRQKGHYSSYTGGNGPSFAPPKQRSHDKKKAEGDNDDVDEHFHGRYLHRHWRAGQHSRSMRVMADISTVAKGGRDARLILTSRAVRPSL